MIQTVIYLIYLSDVECYFFLRFSGLREYHKSPHYLVPVVAHRNFSTKKLSRGTPASTSHHTCAMEAEASGTVLMDE